MLSDLTRYYVVISALWVTAVLLRMLYLRASASTSLPEFFSRTTTPHPLSVAGLIILMMVAIARRFNSLGQPGDAFLWFVTAGVTLVLAGVLMTMQFTLAPPWARRQL